MSTREMSTLEAMIDALRIEMRRDPTVINIFTCYSHSMVPGGLDVTS